MTIFSIPSKEDIGRILLHIPCGLAFGLSYFAHWVFPLALTALFIFYEKNQDIYVKDQAWKDTKGTIWGLAIAGIVIAILKIGGFL